MSVRLVPAALVLAALAADASGRHGLAGYLLVAGVPAAAAAALHLFGRLVELPARARGEAYVRFESSLAARSGVAEGASLPPLTASAVVAALAVYLLQAFTALVAPRPRLPRRRGAAAAVEAPG